jgi:hypothetical protein
VWVNRILSTSTVNDGEYEWTIDPDLVGDQFRIRITSNSNHLVNDTSDGYFAIRKNLLTVLSPNGGETWEIGDEHEVSWTSVGGIGDYVRIELLKGGSVYYEMTPSTLNDGSYSGTIGLVTPPGSDYRIRVTCTSNPAATDTSDSDFSITPTSITVTSPNGEESWQAGLAHTITWTSSGSSGAYVRIELLKGGILDSVIVASTAISSGSYSWLVPAGQAGGSDYQIKITSTTMSVTDSSNSYFSITPPPTITVISPNGGESWMAGSTHLITWASTGSLGTNVKIELWNGPVVSSVIVASTSIGSGSYSWAIPPGAAGSDYKVRITSTTTS